MANDIFYGGIRVGGALTANTTVNFTSGMTAVQMQALIDAVPRNTNGYTLTFQFADGTYNTSMTSSLSFSGFYGGGGLNIYGKTSEGTSHYTTQAVVLDFSAGSCSGISLYGCSCASVQIQNLAIKISDTATCACVMSSQSVAPLFVFYSYLYASGKTCGDNYGIASYYGTNAFLYQNTFSNTYQGIRGYCGMILSWNSYSSGTNPTYGLGTYFGCTLCKFDSTQPTGSTAAETGSGSQGAIIR